MKNRKAFVCFIKALAFTGVSLIMTWVGVAFLILKTISMPFVPNRNIDNMSDYYTAVWESIKGNPKDNGKIAVVDISENSRQEISEILLTLSEMKPRIIGFDVTNLWEENKDTDSILISTLRNIPNIVLPVEYHEMNKKEGRFLFSTLYGHLEDKQYGVVSLPNNRGILRTFCPYFQDSLYTYKALGCEIADNCGADISSLHSKKEHIINYTTLNQSDDDAIPGYQFLHLTDSLFFDSLSSAVSDRIILVGSTHLTNDQHLTPLGYALSGVMVHAHIVNSLLEGKGIKTMPKWIRYVLCLVFAFLIQLIPEPKITSRLSEHHPTRKRIIVSTVLFLSALIVCAGIGTLLFCDLCYYADFAPYIVTIILVYLFKNKEFVK